MMLVALRKESVDRNIRRMPLTRFFRGSLSARRAWIEICERTGITKVTVVVALRKESVDRNARLWVCLCLAPVALRKESVDRNLLVLLTPKSTTVALRKESVDRNEKIQEIRNALDSRSPQGERG